MGHGEQKMQEEKRIIMRVITLWWQQHPRPRLGGAGSLYTRYAIRSSGTDLGPQCQQQQMMTPDELDRMRLHHHIWQREQQWPYLVREEADRQTEPKQRRGSLKARDVEHALGIREYQTLVVVRCSHTGFLDT